MKQGLLVPRQRVLLRGRSDSALNWAPPIAIRAERHSSAPEGDGRFVVGTNDVGASARARDGGWAAGIAAVASWLAGAVPVFSPNLVLATAADLVALGHPESQPAHVLEHRTRGLSCEGIGTH